MNLDEKKLLKQIGRCTGFHRCTDALIYLLLTQTKLNDKIAVPVLTCNTSIAKAIRDTGREIEWIDIVPNTLALNIEELQEKVGCYAAIIVHSYWGYPIQNLESIQSLAKSHNKLLIEDRSHMLYFEDIEPLNRHEKHFVIYSLSKEIPYFLGGLLFPKIRGKEALSYSFSRNARELMAFFSIYADRQLKCVFMKKIITFLLSKINQLRSNEKKNSDKEKFPLRINYRKGLSFLQKLFLHSFVKALISQRKSRVGKITRLKMLFEDNLIESDFSKMTNLNWGILLPRNSILYSSRPFWFEFQQYEEKQKTKNLLVLKKKYSLYFLDDINI